MITHYKTDRLGENIKTSKPLIYKIMYIFIAISLVGTAGYTAYYYRLPICIKPPSPYCPHPPKRNPYTKHKSDGSTEIACRACR